jgi:CubicO group peptidase (beta-lactamase class C family)
MCDACTTAPLSRQSTDRSTERGTGISLQLSDAPCDGEVIILIPATPAGLRLQSFLDTFNTGSLQRCREFIADHHLPGPPWEEIYARFLHDMHGLVPVRVEASTDFQIALLAQPKLYDGWIRLTLSVALEAPHAIQSIRPAFVGRPADIDPLSPISEAEMLQQSQTFTHALADADMFSGTLLIARNGEPLLHEAWGLASRAHSVPNRIDTKFNLGSMNKMFTAVSVLQLAQAGKLALTDTISQHLPNYPTPAAETITIHHLLCHTSGLGSYWNEQFAQSKSRLRQVTDFLPLFQDQPLAFEPGERFQYSNSGFILLGAVIEATSGMSYFEYVRAHIYRPGGMINTEAFAADEEVPNLAMGYTHTDWQNRFHADRWFNNLFLHVVMGGPAGGGFSTAPDLLRFANTLLAHRLLTPEYTALLLANQTGDDHYAYGFMADSEGQSRVVGHAGGFPGICSNMDIFLDRGYTAVIMTNCDPPAALWVRDKVRELIHRIP